MGLKISSKEQKYGENGESSSEDTISNVDSIESQENDTFNNKSLKELDLEAEIETSIIWLERKSFRIALISTFTALSIVFGYMLAYLPNIEIFTLTLFLSGFILGKRDGAIIGLMSSFIFCFLNPLGTSPLPLLVLQLSYYSIVGLFGGFSHDILRNRKFYNPQGDLYIFPVMFLFGIIGACLTFTYDLFSTIVLALSVFGTMEAFWPNYLLGVPFTMIHLIGNIILFVFLLPGEIQVISKLMDSR